MRLLRPFAIARVFLRQDDKLADFVCGDCLWSLFVEIACGVCLWRLFLDIFLSELIVTTKINFSEMRLSLRCDCFVPRNYLFCGDGRYELRLLLPITELICEWQFFQDETIS